MLFIIAHYELVLCQLIYVIYQWEELIEYFTLKASPSCLFGHH